MISIYLLFWLQFWIDWKFNIKTIFEWSIFNWTCFLKRTEVVLEQEKIDWKWKEKVNQSKKIIKENTATDYDYSSCLNHDLCIFIQTQEKYDDDNAFHTAYTHVKETRKEKLLVFYFPIFLESLHCYKELLNAEYVHPGVWNNGQTLRK